MTVETSSTTPIPDTVDVLGPHRFDESALHEYLTSQLPEFGESLVVRQFQGGQSNPTYVLFGDAGTFVLRKKPPGELLPKAHQIEREYQVMHALKDTAVPVPSMCVLCEDPDVIGTAFFVMRYVPGIIAADPALPTIAVDRRADVYRSVAQTLAALHCVDWQSVGLTRFGRPDAYFTRQLKTWTRQYEAAQTEDMPAMNQLIDWLSRRLPDDDTAATATIVHGDYRAGNLIVDQSEARVAAVIDWELATIGHPLADLGYLCMPYYLPYDVPGVRGFQGIDLNSHGLLTHAELVDTYCAHSGRASIKDLEFYTAFAMFRLAAILQGVYARGMAGNASNTDATEVGARASLMAQTGWEIARGLRD